MGGSCTKDKTIKDSVAISDLINKEDLQGANNLINNLAKASTNSITKSTNEKNNLKNVII